MKKINLTAAIEAFRAMIAADESAESAARYSERFQVDYEIAAGRAKDARKKYCAICDKLDADAILPEQGKARERRVYASDIVRFLCDYTDRMNIPKTMMKGITITADLRAQHFPNAYKYVPESTHFRAEHNGKTWFLTAVYRDTCRATIGTAHLPEAAKAAIIANAEKL